MVIPKIMARKKSASKVVKTTRSTRGSASVPKNDAKNNAKKTVMKKPAISTKKRKLDVTNNTGKEDANKKTRSDKMQEPPQPTSSAVKKRRSPQYRKVIPLNLQLLKQAVPILLKIGK